MRIYKYTLAITDIQYLEMPIGAKVLSVANQNGQLCLWAMVDPQEEVQLRRFEIIGTGNPMPPHVHYERKFVGTVLIDPFVWHVFELTQ